MPVDPVYYQDEIKRLREALEKIAAFDHPCLDAYEAMQCARAALTKEQKA